MQVPSKIPTAFIVLLLVASLIGCINMDLDEAQIIKDSRAAFAKETYREEVFVQAHNLNRMKNFLMRNVDTIIFYDKTKHYISFDTIQKRNRRYHRLGGEMCIPIWNDSFINQQIPAFLRDSLRYYSKQLDRKIISYIVITGDGSNVGAKPNMVFGLSYKEANNAINYYVNHWVSFNN
jgi:hypothetical protein